MPQVAGHSHITCNKVSSIPQIGQDTLSTFFLLARFTLVGKRSLQALQINCLTVLVIFMFHIAFQLGSSLLLVEISLTIPLKLSISKWYANQIEKLPSLIGLHIILSTRLNLLMGMLQIVTPSLGLN